MSKKAISISLAKVDYDFGEPYIKVIASCPGGFLFNKMIITINYVESGKWKKLYFDVTELLEVNQKQDIILNIPVKILGGFSGEAIYEIELGAESDDYTEHIDDYLVLSDVHHVFKCLIDGLLNSDPCSEISDDIIKKYLILYGHQQAMWFKQLDAAKEFYALMTNCFKKCGMPDRIGNDCGCK